TVKVALVAPAAMVTLAGTVAAGLASLRVISAPPAGATPVSVTVAVEVLPLTTDAGFRVKVLRGPGFTVSTAVFSPVKLALIVTAVLEVTPTLVTVNVPVVAPAATVTVAGTVAAGLLEASETAAPPVGAAAFNVTVPVLVAPDITAIGARTRFETV